MALTNLQEHGTTGTRLSPELTLEVYRALNFNPAEFAQRHGAEFTRMYLRADGMLSYVGEEIVSYLARRLNECLSRADYALLSYIEYAGRAEKTAGSDCFDASVARYLHARKKAGSDWSYAFEREESKAGCAAYYIQMYAMAQAMYDFAREIGEFKEIAGTDGPEAWPDPKKVTV